MPDNQKCNLYYFKFIIYNNIMAKLNTGWKHWDMYLSKFVNKKINCLDIGSFKGDSTCWMLNNICQNPYSRVYSVDTWEGSPEYNSEVKFDKIEKEFDQNVLKTGNSEKNVKMKMSSIKALLKLKEYGLVIFDFIFIDASHEAKDVLSDAILSWEILNEEGILIFDDYKWDKLNEEYFKPKIAIDSFVSIYKNQLEVLYVGYQYIIKKINISHVQKPELADEYKLLDKLQYFKFYENEIVIDEDNKEEIKFKLDIVKEDDQYTKIINKINNLIEIFDKQKLLDYYSYSEKYKDVLNNLNKTKYNLDQIQTIAIYKILNKYLKNDMSIYINRHDISKEKIKFLKKYLNLNLNIDFDNIIILNENIFNNLIKKKNTFDILYFGNNDNDKVNYKFNQPYILFNLIFALNKQNINGTIIQTVNYNNISLKLLLEIIFIFKKYFKNIILKSYFLFKKINRNYIIIFENFIGINKNELDNINKLVLNIFTNYHNNNYINSIIKNNYNNNKIINFYNQKILNIYNYVNIINNINIKDYKIINNIKKICFIRSLLSFLTICDC
jgi:predicted O-methyltransferase YrrM